jgi:hypothetical protein
MLTPAKRKLILYKGAKFDPGWTWKAAGVPVDLTGCTARMQVRADVDSPDVLLDLTTENGGIILGGAAGTIDLWVGATDTTAITWDGGVWALDIQYATGPDDVDRLIEGSISVSPEVPRDD